MFFRTKDGQFSQLCGFLDLPEQLIRQQVNKQSHAALTAKRNEKEQNNGTAKHLERAL